MWATSAFQERVLVFFSDLTPPQKMGIGIVMTIIGVIAYVAVQRDFGTPDHRSKDWHYGSDWEEVSKDNSLMDFIVDYDHPLKWLQVLGMIVGVIGICFLFAGYVLS